MKIEGSVVLVTGGNRGLGAEYVRHLLSRGASKVYVGARNAELVNALPSLTGGRAIPISLDITKASDISAAVESCSDITMLINNAGIALKSSILADNSLENAKAEFETNVWGPFNLSKAFAPVLAKNGGGAIVNVLSAASWFSMKEVATYAMSKSAAWSFTNGLRIDVAPSNTLVVAVHAGFIDTEMAANVKMDKTSPFQVVDRTLNAVEAGVSEVLADDSSVFIKNNLPNHIETFYPLIARHDYT